MARKFTYGDKLAVIILSAHNVGCDVSMHEEAEHIITDGNYKLAPVKILTFETCARDAIDEVNAHVKMTEAQNEANKIINQYYK